MLGIILAVLIVLWFLGYVHLPAIPISDTSLFVLFGKTVTLYDLLIFILIFWLIDLLPGVFRTIATVLLIIWLLSFFGIIAVSGLTNVIVLVVIFSLIFYLLSGGH